MHHLLKLVVVRARTGLRISLHFQVPVSHVEVGRIHPGGYEPTDTQRIDWSFVPEPGQSLPPSVESGLEAELEDHQVLKVIFDVPPARKRAAAEKVRRQVGAHFRRTSPGVWSSRGLVLDLLGDKDDRSPLQLTITSLPPAHGH